MIADDTIVIGLIQNGDELLVAKSVFSRGAGHLLCSHY